MLHLDSKCVNKIRSNSNKNIDWNLLSSIMRLETGVDIMIDFGALKRIGRDVRKGFKPSLDIKLKNKEIHLLSMIEKHPSMPFIYYSERIGLERSSFSYLSEMLELKGMLKKEDSSNDKRTKTLILTEQGAIVAAEIESQFQDYLINLLSVLSLEEYREYDSSVEKIKLLMKKIKNAPKK